MKTVWPPRLPELWNQLVATDEALLLRFRASERPALTPLMRFFTHLGDGASWTLAALALLAAGGTATRVGIHLALAATLGAGLAQVGKRLWQRPRPDQTLAGFVALAENPDRFSFPSGHTATAFAVAIALAGVGGILAPLTLVLAVGIALSRIYVGAHYPLDVAAGLLAGTIAGLATLALLG